MPSVTLIYDDTCAFCRRGMRWFATRSHAQQLDFVARHSDAQRARFPDANHEQYMGMLLLVDAAGRIHTGADAFTGALCALPQRHWRTAGRLAQSRVLRPIARLAYRALAAYRQRTRCDSKHCR